MMPQTNFRRTRGFTLIELMVGIAVALLGLAAVSSMMITFSKKRATITQSMTAQDNGVMALYRIERDVGQAGYGLMGLLTFCSSITNSTNPAISTTPLVITDGGTGSDSILTQFVNSPSGVPGTELSVSGTYTLTTTQYNVRSSVGFAVADAVASTTDCVLRVLTSVSSTALGYYPTGTASSNTGFVANLGRTTWSGAGVPTLPSTLADLVSRSYAVNATAGTLTIADYPSYTAATLVDDIVFLKAQYGVAGTTSSTVVSRWVSGATPVNNGTSCTGSPVGAACIVAIRVGVVSRSSSPQKETVDQPNPMTVLPALTGSVTAAAATYALPDTTYRYRAYSTVIPLRNVIWTR